MLNLKDTDNETLVAKIHTLAASERACQVDILRLLAEIDERRLVMELGYSGLWAFCRRALKFSESTSSRRIIVARAARQYPCLLEMLDDGRLTLCTAADLVPLLTEENAERLMAAASGKSRREVQNLAVSPTVRSVERDVIRRVPRRSDTGAMLPGLGEVAAEKSVEGVGSMPPPAAVADTRVRVAFTADEDVVRKLERLQEILGGATLAEVCDRAAEVLLEQVDPARRARRREQKKARMVTKRPTSTAKIEARRPKLADADEIKAAAGGRCTYVSRAGVRCDETRYLSIDHVRPYALGGSSEAKNLRCFCMAHNLAAGRRSFGERSR